MKKQITFLFVIAASIFFGASIPQTTSPAFYWPYFNFSASVPAVSIQTIPWFVECDGDITKGKSAQVLSSVSSDTDSCANAIDAAYNWEQNGINPGPTYDTMKWYISHCYNNPSGETWNVFGGSLDSVSQTAAGRQDVFNFIIYALGLNNSDGWFCGAVPFTSKICQLY